MSHEKNYSIFAWANNSSSRSPTVVAVYARPANAVMGDKSDKAKAQCQTCIFSFTLEAPEHISFFFDQRFLSPGNAMPCCPGLQIIICYLESHGLVLT